MEPFEPEEIEGALEPVLAEHDVKPGKLYQPIRVAISGGSVSPGIFESLSVLGKDRSLERIDASRGTPEFGYERGLSNLCPRCRW